MSMEQPTSILDDLVRMQELDTRNMLRLINELPEQCETALGIGRSIVPGESIEPPSLVFVSGVGDSGTSANMAVAAVSEFVDLPVISDHGGPLPRYVGENALVFLLDYTGKSKSSLRIYKEAKRRGAKVVCITSGGPLREMVVKDGGLIVRIPPGQPVRTAFGYMFVPAVALFEQFGLAQGLIEKLSYGIRHMKNVREMLRYENPTARNIAKQIALSLTKKLAIICGAQDYRNAIASRWKSQINANSKKPVMLSYFPDFAEGEISGWEGVKHMKSDVVIVLLKDRSDRTEIPAYMDAAAHVLGDFNVIDAEMKGSTTIEKLLYGVYLADYVSYYKALSEGTDPTTTDYVSQVEAFLTGEPIEEKTPDVDVSGE